MQRLLCIVFIFIGSGLCLSGASTPMAWKPTHKYSIQYCSEEDGNIHEIYGSFLWLFQDAESEGLRYVYYINPQKRKEGCVLDYKETPQGSEYVLERFFGQSDAAMQILDMPNADNIKVAMIYYAVEEEDTVGVCWQHILMDEEFMNR